MNYKKKILFFSILLLLFALMGCKTKEYNNKDKEDIGNMDKESIEDIKPVPGGQIVIPLTSFSTLNPLLTDNSSYYHFSKLIFQGLFEFDKNLKPFPKLAKSYELSEDGKRVLIKLKDDIKWHDGFDFTSSDVEFTINAIKRAGIDSTYGKVFKDSISLDGNIDLNSFINTKIIDSNNIEIIFDREFSNALELLTFPIVPKHTFSNIETALSIDPYKPIGTGPFKFIDYEKFKTVNLSRNDEYWNGPVYIEEIRGKVLEDNDLILTSFETGQIDFAFSMDLDWDKYRQNERIKVYEYISSDYEFLGFNFKKEDFSNPQAISLRKAINYGIDRQNIIQNQYLGHGSQIDLPIHPNSYLLADSADKYGYNVNFAKEELKNAGYIDRDGDGILEDENGRPLKFSLLTNTYNLPRLRAGEMIIEDLRKIGIDLTLVENQSASTLISDDEKNRQWNTVEDSLNRGDYDIVLLGWKTSVIPNISYMFHSSKINNTNFIGYENQDMDRLLESSLSSSIEKKEEVYKILQDHILENLPYVSLFYKNQALLVDSKIKGELNPNFFNLYEGLEESFILP